MRGFSRSVVTRFVAVGLSLILGLQPVLQLSGTALAAPNPTVDQTTIAIPMAADATATPDASAEASPTIVRELLDRRTETSKHYLLSNGRQRAVISEVPVHYKDGSGRWVDIDTNLTQEGPGRYRTTAATVTAEFASGRSEGDPVTVSTGQWSMSLDMEGASLPDPVAIGDTAYYSDVATDTSLTYRSLADGLKETIVLASAQSPSTYTFDLKLQGASLESAPDGGYALVSDEGREVVARLGALTVTDAKGATCDAATMRLAPGTGTRLEISLPESWLQDPDRAFPVKVDPTVTLFEDTYVASGSATTAFGSDTFLRAGHWSISTIGYTRALAWFDVSSIASDTDIYSATFSAYMYSQTGGDTLWLSRPTSAWNESTTWNTKPAHTYLTSQTRSFPNWVDWSVTSTVKGWVNHSLTNYGLSMYVPEDSSHQDYHQVFYSSEYSDGRYRPKLVVDYNSLPADLTALPGTNSGLDWWRASSATAKADIPKAGRGVVNLSWTRPARAAGYRVYMYDGAAYRQVADIADPRYTSWSSQDAQPYPSDTEIGAYPQDYTGDPYARSATPCDATQEAGKSVSIAALSNTGVVATDGSYLYVRPMQFGVSAPFYRVGNGIESTAAPVAFGASLPGGPTAFYLDGVVYNGYATTASDIQGIWKGGTAQDTQTKTLHFSKPLLNRATGAELTGATYNVLLATDGERIYSGAYEIPPGADPNGARDGYRIRVYDRDGTWIEDRNIPMQSNYCDGFFADGESFYFLKWTSAASTVVDKISMRTYAPVNRWSSLAQGTGGVIGGCYDAANDVFWLGLYSGSSVYRYKGPGLDLRDNPNALYKKTPGTTYDNSVNYWFRVTSYNDDGETAVGGCPPYMPTLPNRTITANDDPRHTTEDLGQFAQHSASAVLDKKRLDVSVTDLSIASYGPTAELSRTYRSDDTGSHGFAPGWRFDFDQAITVNGSTYTWTDAEGEAHAFTYDAGTGAYVAPPGLTATMTRPGGGYQIDLPGRRKLTFDSTGRLTSEADRNGNTVSYAAVGDDIVITAANGQTISVDRDASHNVLSATYATADGSRVINYTNGTTPSVTYFPGQGVQHTVQYTYSSSRLTDIAVPSYPAAGQTTHESFIYSGSDLTEVRFGDYDATSRPNRKATISYGPGSGATVSRTGDVGGAQSSVVNSYTWNPNGTMATKVDPHKSGDPTATWSYTYAPNNEVTEEDSPTGAKKVHVVDALGNLLSDYDEAGHRSAYVYESHGDVIRSTDPRGDTTYYTLDANGNILEQDRVLDGSGTEAVTTFVYGAAGHGQPTSKTDKISGTASATTTYQYGVSGQVTVTTNQGVKLSPTANPIDLTAQTDYDAFGNAIRVYDALGGSPVTTNAYDLAGRLTSSTDASSVVTSHVFDKLGFETETWRSAAATDTKADWHAMTYDGAGRPLTDTAYLYDRSQPASRTVQTVVTKAYDDMGREKTSNDNVVGGQPAKTYYDALGNTTRSWSEGVPAYDLNRSTRTDFDAYGRETKVYDPGNESVYTTKSYYPDGNVFREDRPDGTYSTYTYDDGDNKVSEVTPDGSGGQATSTWRYDVGGRLVSETTADGATTTHSYDLLGRETTADGQGSPSTTVYNTLGWVLSSTDPDGMVTSKTYDKTGRVLSETRSASGASKTTSYTFDRTGKQLTTTDPDGKLDALTYDAFGRIATELQTTGLGEVKHVTSTYDSLGNVVSSTDSRAGEAYTFSYPLNTAGPSTESVTYGGVTTTVTIGADGKETSRASTGGASLTRTATAWDAADRETAATIAGITSSRTFNQAGQLTRTWGLGFASGAAIADTYAYDAAGRKSTDAVKPSYGGDISASYTYTDAGRLATAKFGTATTSYTYDLAGNLTHVTPPTGSATTLTYDASTSRLTSTTQGTTVTNFGYDTLGQRISQGPASNPNSARFGYTGTGRLASYDTSAGVHATFTYDAAGQRTKSIVTNAGTTTTTNYTYDGLTLLTLSATSGSESWSLAYLYDAGGRPYAARYSDGTITTTILLLTTDRGDVIELMDAAGNPFAAYRYDAYGNPTSTISQAQGAITAAEAGKIAQRQVLRYAGYAYDNFSGLYYCSARYYDPLTLQFTSKDPEKADGEGSSYQYCSGNPVGDTDPSGLSCHSNTSYRRYEQYTSTWTFSGGPYVNHWTAKMRLFAVWKPVQDEDCGYHYPWNERVNYFFSLDYRVTNPSFKGEGFYLRIRGHDPFKGYWTFWESSKRKVVRKTDSISIPVWTPGPFVDHVWAQWQVVGSRTWHTGSLSIWYPYKIPGK